MKTIVAGKIHNQYAVLYRHGQKDNSLKSRKQLVKEQTTLNEVRGVEPIEDSVRIYVLNAGARSDRTPALRLNFQINDSRQRD